MYIWQIRESLNSTVESSGGPVQAMSQNTVKPQGIQKQDCATTLSSDRVYPTTIPLYGRTACENKRIRKGSSGGCQSKRVHVLLYGMSWPRRVFYVGDWSLRM